MHGSQNFKNFAASVIPSGDLDFALLVAMRGDKDGDGPLDHPCPLCGPDRTEASQSREVLRTWRPEPDVITYNCARCQAKGVAQASDPPRLNPLPLWVPPPSKPRTSNGESDWYARKLWDAASLELPAKVRTYFRKRGIPLEDVPEGALRFHPKCPWGRDKVPCILARYTNAVTGEPWGIWRRSLRSLDGNDKPKGLGTTKGCVIRLWPQSMVGKRLVLGEGIETTLAAATRIDYRGAALQPAWAAGCANNMKHFPVLKGIEQLILLVDNDKSGTGQEAAEECARRWYDAGRCVIRLMPPQVGTDFNDWVMS